MLYDNYKADLGGGEIGCIESTESILKYLKSKHLKSSELEARLYKANVSKHTRADNRAEF